MWVLLCGVGMCAQWLGEKVRSEVRMGHVFYQCDLTAITSVGDKARDGVGRTKVSYEPRLLICPVTDIFFCGELGFQSAGTEESDAVGRGRTWLRNRQQKKQMPCGNWMQ